MIHPKALASLLLATVAGCFDAGGATTDPIDDTSGPEPIERPVTIGADGYFYLDGKRTIVIGAEEERRVLGDAEVDALIPRLREAGVNFLVIYLQDLQTDYFYDRTEAEGIWIAQHLGTLKKETQQGFSNTGGVIGTIPDEAWYQVRLAEIQNVVPRLAVHRNILFWWLGGELVEPEFHSAEGIAVVREHVRRYRDTLRSLDPLHRPFTVSHHFVEVVEDVVIPFVDYADLTDFTWFTVASHFHLGDFLPAGGWRPVAGLAESSVVMRPILERAIELNRGKPLFLGGWFGRGPLLGPCSAEDQGQRIRETWDTVSSVPYLGFSAYHLDEWDGNGIPHALFTRTDHDWVPTPAGHALREIATSIPNP